MLQDLVEVRKAEISLGRFFCFSLVFALFRSFFFVGFFRVFFHIDIFYVGAICFLFVFGLCCFWLRVTFDFVRVFILLPI